MTLHDLDLGHGRERRKAWTPHVILERRLGHDRAHLRLEKDPHDAKNTPTVRSLERLAIGRDTGGPADGPRTAR